MLPACGARMPGRRAAWPRSQDPPRAPTRSRPRPARTRRRCRRIPTRARSDLRTIQATPTARSDYALLSGTYLSLLAALAAGARNRDDVPPHEIPALAAAAFALTKLLVHEKAESWVRAPFVDEGPDGTQPK